MGIPRGCKMVRKNCKQSLGISKYLVAEGQIAGGPIKIAFQHSEVVRLVPRGFTRSQWQNLLRGRLASHVNSPSVRTVPDTRARVPHQSGTS